MKPNHIVLDLETQNLFSDVGGKGNLHKLLVSVAGVYSHNSDQFLIYKEAEMPELEKLLRQTDLIIGFNIRHFDLLVLQKYISFDLARIPTLDIMADIVNQVGYRVSLDDVVFATLGNKKSAHGLLAVQYWREGRLDELKNYCLDDVRLTRDLYEHGAKSGEIRFMARDANMPYMKSLNVNWEKYLNGRSTSSPVIQSSLGF